jgi:pimeloyl-ACP methyl ester carboxylesterase
VDQFERSIDVMRAAGRAGDMIRANGVELCTESFGDRSDPPTLLIMGVGASMLWWDEAFCRRLADHGRFVIRYDHRDTGRSTTFPPGHPGYTGASLVDDTVAILDGYGIDAAQIVGFSAGGGIAQHVALDHADRVRSLVLISTSPAVDGGRPLPPPAEKFRRFLATAEVDWSDRESIVRYQVAYWHALSGDRPFDENACRDLVRRDIARSRDIAATRNHDLVAGDGGLQRSLSSITGPALVIHGTADPVFPFAHGVELARQIPGARLLPLHGAGHGIERADWDTVLAAIAAVDSDP